MDELPEPDADGTPADGGEVGDGVPRRRAVSPYATGGGGVTLERRIGALYLVALLTGETATELGDARSVVSVAFQQAPRVSVDDLVIRAARPDEAEPSLELAIGIRRRPNIVRSDEDTQKLIVEYVRAFLSTPDDGREHRFGLAVAGPQPHAEQVAELAALARNQMDASAFFALVTEEGKYPQELRRRLDHVKWMVEGALRELGSPMPMTLVHRTSPGTVVSPARTHAEGRGTGHFRLGGCAEPARERRTRRRSGIRRSSS